MQPRFKSSHHHHHHHHHLQEERKTSSPPSKKTKVSSSSCAPGQSFTSACAPVSPDLFPHPRPRPTRPLAASPRPPVDPPRASVSLAFAENKNKEDMGMGTERFGSGVAFRTARSRARGRVQWPSRDKSGRLLVFTFLASLADVSSLDLVQQLSSLMTVLRTCNWALFFGSMRHLTSLPRCLAHQRLFFSSPFNPHTRRL